jgi:hypothetical protein
MHAMKYTDGTPCDIIGNVPRETTIFYGKIIEIIFRSILPFVLFFLFFLFKACDESGNENIAFFEEISSCVYEMVVITKWICAHPAYRLLFKFINRNFFDFLIPTLTFFI